MDFFIFLPECSGVVSTCSRRRKRSRRLQQKKNKEKEINSSIWIVYILNRHQEENSRRGLHVLFISMNGELCWRITSLNSDNIKKNYFDQQSMLTSCKICAYIYFCLFYWVDLYYVWGS